jgi:hypothetical protein
MKSNLKSNLLALAAVALMAASSFAIAQPVDPSLSLQTSPCAVAARDGQFVNAANKEQPVMLASNHSATIVASASAPSDLIAARVTELLAIRDEPSQVAGLQSSPIAEFGNSPDPAYGAPQPTDGHPSA